MKYFLKKVSLGKTLTIDEAESAMEIICMSHTFQEQIAAFLGIIHARGESRDELLGFISYLRNQSLPIDTENMTVMDTCGTGGDHSGSFNISTAAGLLIASEGIKVAKHGGRAVSSDCGSADVLEALGISTQKNADSATNTLKNVGFAFLLASKFNSVFEKIQALRKTLGIRTCFNIVGPLLNPANVKRQVLGVYSPHLLMPLAEILLKLGSEEVMIIHSRDGLDEFSLGAPTDIAHLKEGNIIHCYTVDPIELGFKPASIRDIKGGDADANADIIKGIFSGEIRNQYRDVVILNAAAGFLVSGYASSFVEGVEKANKAIDDGKASDYLQQLKKLNKDNKHAE